MRTVVILLTDSIWKAIFRREKSRYFPITSSHYVKSCRGKKRAIDSRGIISFDWVMNDFLTCVIFCCQNQPFPAEKDVKSSKCWVNSPKHLHLQVTQHIQLTINSFMTEVPTIQKPVHWFAEQITGLVFI